ncbi:N-acetyltransferase [Massilia sp. LC238]|uniref:GNAT family N-acetyltransferase n=1 Tax=Massilia sp. LC238 TaxID=1502852 RepID=UPI0004E2EFE3|nr:GNAT family N-acetyltransferase [Massilia sp. LC238]KFC69695.1 putative acetyltransferase [Massilia sp. LC238]
MQKSDYIIAVEESPDYRDSNLIVQGLIDFHAAHTGGDTPRDLVITVRDETDRIVGGLVGDTYVSWLQVHALWVDESARNCGIGRAILIKAEEEGLRRGCKRVFLETLSFQALAFYQKLGYVVQHRLEGFPPGGARYALTKEHGVAPPPEL